MPRITAGDLTERVTILRPGAAPRDAYGEEVPGADTETETYAKVSASPGSERFANAENAASAPMRFIFRWRDDLVRETDRLGYGGLIWDVKSAIPLVPRTWLEVLAVARTEPA